MPHTIAHYQRKLSGPIIDRIDMFITVDEVDHSNLLTTITPQKQSAKSTLQATVQRAREVQQERNGADMLNASLTNQRIKKASSLATDAKELLDMAASKLAISARSYMRIIKVARTIADIEQSTSIEKSHVTEALTYRRQEQTL